MAIKYQMLISGMLVDITQEQAYQLKAHNDMFLRIDKTGYIVSVWQQPSQCRHQDFNPRYIFLHDILTDTETGEKICKKTDKRY